MKDLTYRRIMAFLILLLGTIVSGLLVGAAFANFWHWIVSLILLIPFFAFTLFMILHFLKGDIYK